MTDKSSQRVAVKRLAPCGLRPGPCIEARSRYGAGGSFGAPWRYTTMPANLPPQYLKAEEEYRKASTP